MTKRRFLFPFSCSKDNTLQYNYNLSAVQRFSLRAFKFQFEKSSEVFLHCKLKACLSSDEKSRCSKGCPFGKRKRRASLFETDRYLAIGPIVLSPSKHEQLSKKTGTKCDYSRLIVCDYIKPCSLHLSN